MNSNAATVTVKSTILITAYITAHPTVTTTLALPLSDYDGQLTSSPLSPIPDPSTSTSIETTSSVVLPIIVSAPTTSSVSTSISSSSFLPPIATSISNTGSSQRDNPSSYSSRKPAVIGGLAGAAAGLLFIAVLIGIAMRFRKKRIEAEDHSSTEKGLPRSTTRAWTDAWTDLLSRTSPTTTPSSPEVSVDEQHHIIRMSVQHWPRPYAAGQGESMRDSMAASGFLQLRVTNPDPPRPWTPGQASSHCGSTITKVSRAALAALRHHNRTRPNSITTIASRSNPSSIVINQTNLSAEYILKTPPKAASATARSSTTSLHWNTDLEDPFVTPPAKEAHEEVFRLYKPRRPLLRPVHDAAHRTRHHVEHFLHKTKPTAGDRLAPFMPSHSPAELTPSSFLTGYSDPFDLDRSSGSDFGHMGDYHERPTKPKWAVT